MKKILTTAILCAGLVGFTACDSFLDEDPKSSLTLDTYYKTSAVLLAMSIIYIVMVLLIRWVI